MDGPGELNWTFQTTESGRSWAKVDGPKAQSGRSAKVDGSKEKKLDGPKEENY